MAARITLLLDATADGVACTLIDGADDGARARVFQARHPQAAGAVEAERAALMRAIRRALARPGDARRREAITTHGRLLFDLLLPPAIKQRLRTHGGGALCLAARGLAGIPWQALHDGAAPLGLRWALGELRLGERLPSLESAQDTRGERLLVVADPAGDLPAARFEGEALMKALAGDAGLACDLRLGRLRRADLLRIFKSFRMIHFAGHADPATEDQPAGWRLADGHVDAAAIAALAGGNAPRLLFLNACRSAETHALIEALIDAGVRHIIGANVDLPDLPGADFALQVYRGLRGAAPIGEALRQARAQAFAADDPIWAAYRLLGDPTTAYLRPRPTERGAGGIRRGVVLAVRSGRRPGSPEARIEAARRAREALRERIHAHGGRLLPGRGAVARAVFGVPFAHENDIERAVAVALALAEVPDPERRIVLSAGPLALEGVDVLGDAALEAEAGCWSRPPGVWADAAVTRALGARGGYGPDGQLIALVRGAQRPMHALVGRRAELERVERAADAGRTVTVIGPAGIGKSHLAAAALDRLRERFRVVHGPAPGHGEAHPFQTIAPMVRALLDLDPAADPAAIASALRDRLAALDAQAPADDAFLSIDALLADEIGEARLTDRLGELAAVLDLPALAAGADPRAVPGAVRSFLAAIAQGRPLALCFEAIHALSAEALAVVEELLSDPPDGCFVLCIARPDLAARTQGWAELPGHERIELGPVADREAEAIVRQVCPGLAKGEAAALIARAAGNPLFLRELGLARAEGQAELPLTIEAVLQARVDRLPPTEQQLLRVAAIFGRIFWESGVQRLIGRGVEVATRLAALGRGRFVQLDAPSAIEGTAQWRFAHPLLQEVLLAGLNTRTRRAGHARAALWLSEESGARDAHLVQIARHLDAAGDAARAAEVWLQAAERARAVLAPGEAIAALRSALASDEGADARLPAARRAEAEARLGGLLVMTGEPAEGAQLLDAALARPVAPVDRAEWLRQRAEIDETRSDLAAAEARLAEARALVADRDTPAARAVAVELDRDTAWLAVRDGDYARAEAILSARLAAMPADDPKRARVHLLLGVAVARKGDAEQAQRWYRQAIAGARAAKDVGSLAAAYMNLGNLALEQADYPGAIGWLTQAMKARARQGNRDGLARTYGNLGTLHAMEGAYDKAARYLGEAIRIRQRTGHVESAVYEANLGEVYLRQGRLDEAGPHLERAIAQCRARTAPAYLLPDALRSLADLRLAQGDAAAARVAAEEAASRAEESGDRPRAGAARRVLGEALAALGAPGAAEALDAAVAIFEALDDPLGLGKALAARARLSEDATEAARLRAEARALFEQIDAKGELERLDAAAG